MFFICRAKERNMPWRSAKSVCLGQKNLLQLSDIYKIRSDSLHTNFTIPQSFDSESRMGSSWTNLLNIQAENHFKFKEQVRFIVVIKIQILNKALRSNWKIERSVLKSWVGNHKPQATILRQPECTKTSVRSSPVNRTFMVLSTCLKWDFNFERIWIWGNWIISETICNSAVMK